MLNRRKATINITKAIAGISFASLAAIGSASNNMVFAGIAALPAAVLASSATLGSILSKFRSQQEKVVLLDQPSWWASDIRSWQNLCSEIENHLPHILQVMAEQLQKETNFVSTQMIQQTFIEAVTFEPLTWAFEREDRRRAAEAIASPILDTIDVELKPVIEQINNERYLIDIHSTASATRTIEMQGETHIELLRQIYEEVRKPHNENAVPESKVSSQTNIEHFPALNKETQSQQEATTSPVLLEEPSNAKNKMNDASQVFSASTEQLRKTVGKELSPSDTTKEGKLPDLLNQLQARQLSIRQRYQLVDLLFACETLFRKESREMVIKDLRSEIAGSLLRDHQNAKLDIRHIVDACLNYPGGLYELIEVLRSNELESLSMKNLDEFIKNIFFNPER